MGLLGLSGLQCNDHINQFEIEETTQNKMLQIAFLKQEKGSPVRKKIQLENRKHVKVNFRPLGFSDYQNFDERDKTGHSRNPSSFTTKDCQL